MELVFKIKKYCNKLIIAFRKFINRPIFILMVLNIQIFILKYFGLI